MKEDELEKKVIKIISETAEVPEEKIKLESNIMGDLELESLDVVDLVSAFEEEFGVEIEDEDIKKFQTVKDIVDYLKK